MSTEPGAGTPEVIARQVREDIEEAERDIGHSLDNEAIENIVYENVREARRELLAAVDDVRQRLADRGQPQNPEWARLIREAIEESSRVG